MEGLPKYIIEAIKKSAKYHKKAREQQKVFETWIQENFGEDAINDDGIRDAIIDRIEQSNDPEGAIENIVNILDEYKIE